MLKNAQLTNQSQFLEKIKYLLPSNISFVDTLAQILGLSIDSIYRRLRGETAITFDETVKLCRHFNLSVDSIIEGDASVVTFNYNVMCQQVECFKDYLRSILEDLHVLNKFENPTVIYVAEDIPIFHLFAFKELAAFKMYYWLKSVLNVPEYQHQKYSFNNTDPEILELGSKILEAYSRIKSIEIWTEFTINSLRKQIEYYYEAGLFENPDDAARLCDQASELVKHLSHMAEKGSKLADTSVQNYTLYSSEIEIGNNCILVGIKNLRKVYLTYNTFSKMTTSNEKFCEATHTWINYLISKAILISGVSEKQRLQFVNKIISQLDLTRKKIQ
ncbi:MAG: helix-turn-helix domain-containing protein [Bacteroidales bacterium]